MNTSHSASVVANAVSTTRKGTTLARGVSSAARIRARPLVLSSAYGARVVDESGVEYKDFVLGMGPMLLGHARAEILERVQARMKLGTMFGTTKQEFELADQLCDILPHAETVAFVNSGSEATHLAVRIARARTGRRLIVKFEGHYHGWLEPLFLNTQNNASADAKSFPVPPVHSVPGQEVPSDVLVIRWNDIDEVKRVFDEFPGQIAGVILEPVPMNFGTMLPDPNYIKELREVSRREGAVLIFDEVLSGFRLSLGGAAELIGVEPDLAVYAKAIANGFPLAAVAGTLDAMQPILTGPMFPAGTYSGNPVSVEASLATLSLLVAGGTQLYADLEARGALLALKIRQIAADTGAPLSVNQVGSVLQMFWGVTSDVKNYADADVSNREVISQISESQLTQGSLVSGRGLVLLSTAHTDEDVNHLANGIRTSVEELV